MSFCSVKMSCFNLQDNRSTLGTVTNKTNGRIYGHITKDSDQELRAKLAFLSAIQAPIMLLGRLPYRLYAVCSGDFVKSGIKAAKKEWQLKCQERSLQWPKKSSIKLFNGYNFTIAKHVMWHLLKNICKIITIPLAIIAQQFAALYGLINPLDGRIIFAAIAELGSRDVIPIYAKDEFAEKMLQLSDYLGLCLQPKDVWDSKKLYCLYNSYNLQTIRSLLNSISAELRDKQLFFQNEELNVATILSHLRTYQINIKKVSYSDTDETLKNGTLKEGSDLKEVVRKCLQVIAANLTQIEQTRELIIAALSKDASVYPITLQLTIKQAKEQIMLIMTQLDGLF